MSAMSIHERAINFNPLPNAVVGWCSQRLREAGLPGELAWRVAADCAYDVHEVLELVDRDCPPELALRILAPLEERS